MYASIISIHTFVHKLIETGALKDFKVRCSKWTPSDLDFNNGP